MSAERRGADTRSRILEIAEQEFAASGYAGAHLQLIASQIGVQKTALYYYFPSKAALYEAVLLRMLDAFDGCVKGAIDGAGTPPERLAHLLDALNELFVERRNYSRILLRLFTDRAPIEAETVGPVVERVVGRVIGFYKAGVDSGDFVRQSSRHTFQTLLGALLFHYASLGFGAAVIGVDDIFAPDAAAWRGHAARRLLLRAMLIEPAAGQDG
jgi:TetR/AcrR family transcriptional regulator